jgi:hypothetical protein
MRDSFLGGGLITDRGSAKAVRPGHSERFDAVGVFDPPGAERLSTTGRVRFINDHSY